MLIITTETYPGKEIKSIMGLVSGSTVQCKNFGKDIGAGFRNLVGGEMKAYKEMLDESRRIAMERMIEDATRLGANAIIGFRLMSSAVAPGAAEMVAFGTAVIIE